MATIKITTTLPDRQVEEIRRRVAAEESPSISGFIQQAVQKSLEPAAEFRAMVDEALNETGGAPQATGMRVGEEDALGTKIPNQTAEGRVSGMIFDTG